MLLPGWSLNQDFAIDVAVTDPINGTFKLDLEACDKYAEKYKHDKYDEGFTNTQIVFIPVIFSSFGSLNEEGYCFLKDLLRRNCDSLAQERCTYMPLLWQQLSISLHKENFKMMSRRFKISNDLSKLKFSTTNGIPVIQNDSVNPPISIQSNHILNLEEFLKERMEESNRIFNNLTSESFQKNDSQEMEEESYLQENEVISEYINEEIPETELENSNLANEESEEHKTIKKEDSYSEHYSLPKKGDKVKVKYSDGWYTGSVHSVSSKKKYFWVDFKGFDELYKVRRCEKFKII